MGSEELVNTVGILELACSSVQPLHFPLIAPYYTT